MTAHKIPLSQPLLLQLLSFKMPRIALIADYEMGAFQKGRKVYTDFMGKSAINSNHLCNSLKTFCKL
jgi:hypothetical protein